MSKPMADTPKRRARRQFTDEFKASAVRLVLDEGKTVSAAARDLSVGGHAAEGFCAAPLQAGRLLGGTTNEPVDGARPGP